MSNTVCLAPIISAIHKSEDFLGFNRVWTAINKEQKEFLHNTLYAMRHEVFPIYGKFSEKELRAWASKHAQELNEILEREKFSIRLEEFKEGEFGTVSILDVLTEWLVEGLAFSKLEYKKREYPAVTLEANMRNPQDPRSVYECFGSRHHNFPIAMLNTKSDDCVYMTVAGKSYAGFELMHRIDEVRNSLSRVGQYDSLVFPMVNLDQEVDIGWLKGMWTMGAGGGQYEISQALQQTKFKMNQFGARVRSAVAIGVRAAGIREPLRYLVIDQPFFLWITRPGVSTPILYAYIDEKDWKDPGNLENM